MDEYIKNINEPSFETWFLNNFGQETINRMAERSTEEVCGPMTYFANTNLLFDRFQDEIWRLATEYSFEYVGESILMTLAGDRTISAPAAFVTTMVLAASDCLARRHQKDPFEQGQDDDNDDEDE